MVRLGMVRSVAVLVSLFAAGCSSEQGREPGEQDGGQNMKDAAQGAGGGNGSGGDCDVPTDQAVSALCLSFEPEQMRFEQDPELDGRGQLLVQVYDTPTPDRDGRLPLDVRVFPDQPDPDSGAPLNEASITELPTIRFEGLPSTVYVRAQFYDNPLTFGGLPLWGFWAGGADLSEPFAPNPDTGELEANLSLTPIELPAGEGTAASMDLLPMRRLDVDVSLASGVTPLDDGDGPILMIAYGGPTSESTPSGIGADCVDVAAGSATVSMTVLGTGPHYLWASLNDFNVGGDPAPGVLENAVTRADGVVSFPDDAKVELAADQYLLRATLTLGQVEPTDPNNEPEPFACP